MASLRNSVSLGVTTIILASIPGMQVSSVAGASSTVLIPRVTGGCDMDGINLVCTPSSCAPLACNTYLAVVGGVRYNVCACGSSDAVLCCQLATRYSDNQPFAIGECSVTPCNEAFPECFLLGNAVTGWYAQCLN